MNNEVKMLREALLAIQAERDRANRKLQDIKAVLSRGEDKPLQKLREIEKITSRIC